MLSFTNALQRIPPNTYARWLPILVLILAAAVRFHRLPAQSLWNDEGNTLRLVERSIPDLIGAASQDIHPPGYYLALKGWYHLLGAELILERQTAELTLRLFSAFCGILTVAFTYALGKRLFAPGVGLVAAYFVAFNGFQVYYSQEMRMYALLALLSAASMWCYTSWMRSPRPQWAIALGVINALGLYTHYAFPAVILAQGISTLFLMRKLGIQRLTVYSSIQLLTIVVFSPLLSTAYRQVTGWPRTGQPTDPLTGVATILRWLIYGNTTSSIDPFEYLWFALFALFAFAPDWLAKRHRQPFQWRVSVPVTWLVVTILPFFVLGLFREANLKFLLPVEIAVALLIGRGGWYLWEQGAPVMVNLWESLPRLLALFGMLSTFYSISQTVSNIHRMDQFARDDYRGMSAVIQRDPRPDDAIVLNGPNQIEVFSYYYRGSAAIYSLPAGLGGDDSATRTATQAMIQAHRRVFALYWGDTERDPRRVVEGELNSAAYPAFSRYYGNVRFVLYAIPSAPLAEPTMILNRAFNGGIRLEGVGLDAASVRNGDVLGLTLFWKTTTPIPKRYKVFIHLLDSQGKLVTQRDSEPGNNSKLTSTWAVNTRVIDPHGLLIPISLSGGNYRVIAGLYDLDPPYARLPLIEGGDTLEIGQIQVTP
jgi:hypothetical protein